MRKQLFSGARKLVSGGSGAKFFVETENESLATAQIALLRMRLFLNNTSILKRLRRFAQLLVQIAPERPFFAPFLSFSQRNPQGFPQILCKERVAFPDDSRCPAGKVHDGRRFSFKTSAIDSSIDPLRDVFCKLVN